MLLSHILAIGAIISFVVVIISMTVLVATKLISRAKKAAITAAVALLLALLLCIAAFIRADREFIDSFEEGTYIVDVDKTIVTCETNEADELALILKNKGITKCDIHKDTSNDKNFRCTVDGDEIYCMDYSAARTMLSYKTMIKE